MGEGGREALYIFLHRVGFDNYSTCQVLFQRCTHSLHTCATFISYYSTLAFPKRVRKKKLFGFVPIRVTTIQGTKTQGQRPHREDRDESSPSKQAFDCRGMDVPYRTR